MTQRSMVYKAEHVWKVVALISKAEAVLSSSLHVRIMAFIYHKPRFTWCPGGRKHSKFIKLWEAPGSQPCAPKRNGKLDYGIPKTWHYLSQHFGKEYQRQSEHK